VRIDAILVARAIHHVSLRPAEAEQTSHHLKLTTVRKCRCD
jgi:hypothetical protein